MQPPEIAIVIRGGTVQEIAISHNTFVPPSFRIIDLDEASCGEAHYKDREPDIEGVDIEKFTQKVLKEAGV